MGAPIKENRRDNSLVKRGLLIQNPLSNWIMRMVDGAIRLFVSKQEASLPASPQKILLCNIAQLGDALIATNVLPVLKKRFPAAEIGFLVASESATVLEDHPLVSRLHLFDHFYLHGRNGKAALQHRRSLRRCIEEIQKAGYELAIDLYPYFPNAASLLYKANVPCRVGYESGGLGRLFTHSFPWEYEDRYIGASHLHLLGKIGMNTEKASHLPDYNRQTKRENYVVFHTGASTPAREWCLEGWRGLADRFLQEGRQLVLTGRGERAEQFTRQLSQNGQIRNLCNQLNWNDFVQIIQNASLVVSVNTVTIHLAAASKTPTIAIFIKTPPPDMWSPPSGCCTPYFQEKVDATGTFVDQLYREAKRLEGIFENTQE